MSQISNSDKNREKRKNQGNATRQETSKAYSELYERPQTRYSNRGLPAVIRHRIRIALLALALASLFSLHADDAEAAPKYVDQGTHDKRLAGYLVLEGFKLEVVADYPVVTNPVALTFGDDGTAYVAEWSAAKEADISRGSVEYKRKDGKMWKANVARKKNKDSIKILTSTKPGVFDASKTIIEEELPGSLVFYDGALYTASNGSVRRHSPSKPGGPWDRQETIAFGFGSSDRSQVAGLAFGSDGFLTITTGSGAHPVEGSDGSQATIRHSGGVFRCKPDGSKVEAFASGLCNPRGNPVFDLGSNLFVVEDGFAAGALSAKRRLLQINDLSDQGWRSLSTARAIPDRVRMKQIAELPPIGTFGLGQTAGMLLYHDTRLPEFYRGRLFQLDSDTGKISLHSMGGTGSWWRIENTIELFQGRPKDDNFHPQQAVLGPDGGVYIVDSRRDLNRLEGDAKGGRLLRLSWTGTTDEPAIALRGMDSWGKIGKLDDEKLVATLSADDASDREYARRELLRRGAKNDEALRKVLASEEANLAARIIALHLVRPRYDEALQKILVQIVRRSDSELQRLAADTLGRLAKRNQREVNDTLLIAMASEDASVRHAVALAMGRLNTAGGSESITRVLASEAYKDALLREGLLRAIELMGKTGTDALLSLADSGVQRDTDRVVDIFRALQTKAALEALPGLLKNWHVGEEQQIDLIQALLNYLPSLRGEEVTIDPIVKAASEMPKLSAKTKIALLTTMRTPGIEITSKAKEYAQKQLNEEAEVQREAVLVLCASEAGCLEVGKLLLNGKLPMELKPIIVTGLTQYATKSKEAAELLGKIGK